MPLFDEAKDINQPFGLLVQSGIDIEQSNSDQEAELAISSAIDRTPSRATAPIQVIARMSPRRRWTAEEKRAMVEATYDPTTSVAEVAECFELSPAQLYAWRRQVADGTLDRSRFAAPCFSRVEVAQPASMLPALQVPPACRGTETIEITFPMVWVLSSSVPLTKL